MKPSAITLAMLEQFGGVTNRTLPTAGVSWRIYLLAGGAMRSLGRGG